MRRWQVANSPASLFPARMRSLPLQVCTTHCETRLEKQEVNKRLSERLPAPERERSCKRGCWGGSEDPVGHKFGYKGTSPCPGCWCRAGARWELGVGPLGARTPHVRGARRVLRWKAMGSRPGTARLSSLLRCLTFSLGISSALFLKPGLWEFTTQRRISPRPLCPRLSGGVEKLFIFLNTTRSCSRIPELLFSPRLSPPALPPLPPSGFLFPRQWKRCGAARPATCSRGFPEEIQPRNCRILDLQLGSLGCGTPGAGAV